MFKSIVLLLVLFIAYSQVIIAKEDSDMDSLVAWLPGEFSSNFQHRRDPKFADVRLSIMRCKNLETGSSGYWFYIQQAFAKDSTDPFIQRVIHVQRLQEGMIEIETFEVKDVDLLKQIARNLAVCANLGKVSLKKKFGCELYLQATDKGFQGQNHGTACKVSGEQNIWLKSEIEIRDDGIRIWDRGFDSENIQRWGATETGYVFIKIVKASAE